MAKILWRQAAIDDFDDIYDYIAEDNPVRAASFADELTAKAKFLAENPMVGENKLPALPSVRVFPHRNYVFLFKPLESKKGIELIRIMGGKQNYQVIDTL